VSLRHIRPTYCPFNQAGIIQIAAILNDLERFNMDHSPEESSELTELILNPEITETLLPDALINEEAGLGFLQEINSKFSQAKGHALLLSTMTFFSLANQPRHPLTLVAIPTTCL
jgi:hypothetical protein